MTIFYFFPVCLFANPFFPSGNFASWQGFFRSLFIRPGNLKKKTVFSEKFFKKGIDFMKIKRYNAYLYEYVWEQEV